MIRWIFKNKTMKEPKTIKCKREGCNNTFKQFNSLKQYCSIKCSQSANSKAFKEREKQYKTKIVPSTALGKSYATRVQEARTIFQKYIRLRDAEEPCISCGEMIGEFDAGHYVKAEVFSGLIFHEHNCNKQCIVCNRILDGNQEGYKKGLIEKIGLEQFQALTASTRLNRSHRYTTEELNSIKKVYKAKIKMLKS